MQVIAHFAYYYLFSVAETNKVTEAELGSCTFKEANAQAECARSDFTTLNCRLAAANQSEPVKRQTCLVIVNPEESNLQQL